MKKCAKCEKEFDYKDYGGYVVAENKNLCSKCWEEYIEIKKRHYHELEGWWRK